MTDYRVLAAVKIAHLQNMVESMLETGWECQGGVCHSGEAYAQAMVKKKPSTKTKRAVGENKK